MNLKEREGVPRAQAIGSGAARLLYIQVCRVCTTINTPYQYPYCTQLTIGIHILYPDSFAKATAAVGAQVQNSKSDPCIWNEMIGALYWVCEPLSLVNINARPSLFISKCSKDWGR